MSLVNLIKKGYIISDESIFSKEDVFRVVFENAQKDKYVKNSFLEAINLREKNFPTGLQLDSYAVAIPHTDVEHVNEEFISIIIPKNPIDFNRMDDAIETVKVKIIFLLALKKAESHMKTLGTLLEKIQNETFIESIIKAEDASKIIRLFEKGELND